MQLTKALTAFLLASFASQTRAWGIVGHEIVVTIAQIHLLPSALDKIRSILPEEAKGHLASVANWADKVRMIPAYRFSGELHYSSPLEDYPPSACYFGEKGFKTDHDVIHAVFNYTNRLRDNPSELDSLKFLVHFVGDLHQPLHLTNRDRGGNLLAVRFEGRKTNLHSTWDTSIVGKQVREMTNYSTPLPSTQIESNLRGTIYDPYIRLILWEGVRVWWRSSLPAWLACPNDDSLSSLSSKEGRKQIIFGTDSRTQTDEPNTVCPQEWARQTHESVTCPFTFPPNYPPAGFPSLNTTYHEENALEDPYPLLELNTAEYYGPIKNGKIIERQLAMGGLRLAGVLNSLFASPEEKEKLLYSEWWQDL
ncbi:phospholipase C/P1 nuclease [Meredithblackwellia eburnea MCA 4105]